MIFILNFSLALKIWRVWGKEIELICKNDGFNQWRYQHILLGRVSSKQEHRPTYFVSDITHGPLNVPFSFTQPIALNYRVSRRDCGNIRVRNSSDIDTFRFVSSTELSAALVKKKKLAFLNSSNLTIV